MYLWGAQVETGSDPSSYIPTTTGQVSRVADSLGYQMATNVDAAVGSSYTECYLPVATGSASKNQSQLFFPGGFTPQFFQAPTKNNSFFSGGTVFGTGNSRTGGTVNKGASAWGGATASIVLNGGAVATNTFTPFSPAVGTILVGLQTPDHSLQGSIKNVKFWNTRLIDPQLVSLTS